MPKELFFDARNLSSLVDTQVGRTLKPGTPVDMVEMVRLAMLLDEVVLEIIKASETQTDALEPLTQIAVVASYLRRMDLKGMIISRI